MESPTIGPVRNRLAAAAIAESPQIRRTVVLDEGLVIDLEHRRIGYVRRNPLGVAGMKALTGVILQDVDRVRFGHPRTEIACRAGQPQLLSNVRRPRCNIRKAKTN